MKRLTGRQRVPGAHRNSGTRSSRDQRVRRPIDDDHYVVVDLDFDTAEEATALLEILRTRVWASPSASPALAGSAEARILETVEV
ncbi:hypothetical protein [Aeromicrobium sp.]|uniref:hypothetical protein n=1 Tax=Aeromicrobium sp. TaxID=1871063 RepID=UPI002FCAA6E2